MKNLKPFIREMGREQLVNLSKRAKEAHDILCDKQKKTLLNPSSGNIQEEAVAYEKWLYVAELEEDYLKQKAKLHWLEVRDQNNQSFHSSIQARKAQNAIHEIRWYDSKNPYGDKEGGWDFFL